MTTTYATAHWYDGGTLVVSEHARQDDARERAAAREKKFQTELLGPGEADEKAAPVLLPAEVHP